MDLPLARSPVRARRVSDNAVTRAFGRYGCGTHSPLPARPGPLSDAIRKAWAANGFPLATASTLPGTCPALLEVYPHPALLHLTQSTYRLRYKISRAKAYWPDESIPERITHLLTIYRTIVRAFDTLIHGIPDFLPDTVSSCSALKRYEDALDALVCAWVAAEYVESRVRAYGDADSAIWIPAQTGI